jgi:hypothetical protein
MRNSILAMALVSSGILGGLVGGGIQANRDTQASERIHAFEAFDYDKCNWIVESISKAPDNWKEITRTPGGNWCVSMQQ